MLTGVVIKGPLVLYIWLHNPYYGKCELELEIAVIFCSPIEPQTFSNHLFRHNKSVSNSIVNDSSNSIVNDRLG